MEKVTFFTPELVEDVKKELAVEKISVIGKSPNQIVMTYFAVIKPNVFINFHHARFRQLFSHSQGLRLISTKPNIALWNRIAFEMDTFLTGFIDVSLSLTMQLLCPDFPLWFCFVAFVTRALKEDIVSLTFVQAALTRDPKNPMFATRALRKNLDQMDPEEHSKDADALLCRIFGELYK